MLFKVLIALLSISQSVPSASPTLSGRDILADASEKANFFERQSNILVILRLVGAC